MNKVPVITIDGLSGCGKGTMSQRLALALGWHLLDSGALYRTLAWAMLQHRMDPSRIEGLDAFIAGLEIRFEPLKEGDAPYRLWCENKDITQKIRTEECGQMASKISSIPLVREACSIGNMHFGGRLAWWQMVETWVRLCSQTRR